MAPPTYIPDDFRNTLDLTFPQTRSLLDHGFPLGEIDLNEPTENNAETAAAPIRRALIPAPDIEGTLQTSNKRLRGHFLKLRGHTVRPPIPDYHFQSDLTALADPLHCDPLDRIAELNANQPTPGNNAGTGSEGIIHPRIEQVKRAGSQCKWHGQRDEMQPH